MQDDLSAHVCSSWEAAGEAALHRACMSRHCHFAATFRGHLHPEMFLKEGFPLVVTRRRTPPPHNGTHTTQP